MELRVHGVSGTPIESMLDDPWPAQVAGDDDGRIFRRTHDTPPDRVVEGYHWGRYTAGSPSRALWLLLLPFALVNVARFALLRPDARRRRDRFADAVVRVLGLLMTVIMVVTTCYLAWSVLARQCAPGACEGDFWLLEWFGRRSPGARLVVATVLPLVVLAIFWQFDRLTYEAEPPGRPRAERPGRNGDIGDPGFWRGPQSTSSQRAAHVLAGCAVAGLLALAMLGDVRQWAGLNLWFTGLCVLVAAGLIAGLGKAFYVVVAAPEPKPRRRKNDDHPPAPAAAEEGRPAVVPSDGHDTTELGFSILVTRYATVAAAFAAVALAAVGLDHVRPAGPRGAGAYFAAFANGVGLLLGLALLALLAVTLVLATDAGGKHLRDVPKPFRPFFGGLVGWMGASLGATIGLGMSAAAVFWTARALGDPVLEGAARSPHLIEVATVYWIMAAVWGGLALVLVVSLLPMAAWLLRRHRWWWLLAGLGAGLAVAAWRLLPGELSPDGLEREAEWLVGAVAAVTILSLFVFGPKQDDFEDRLCGDYSAEHGLDRARARVAGRWRVALIRYRYHHVLGLLATLGGLAVIVTAIGCGWLLLTPARPPATLTGNANGPLGQLGVVVVSFGATGLAVLGLGTWRKAGLRTGVGIIWDLLSFWPRQGHPLCPPPYGGRAVLAVAGRASQLINQPAFEADAVVLSGHSQGSVITLAACAVLEEQARTGGTDEDDDLGRQRARRTGARLHMITYGSQLQFLYARFFPAYFGYRRLRGVYDGLDGRWRNVYRWTDPLGGPVLAWAAPGSSSGFGPDIDLWQRMGRPGDAGPSVRCACETPCEPSSACPYPKYWAFGADVRLRDPATIEDDPLQPKRAARGHSGYPGDPAYECVFDDLLSGRQVDPNPAPAPVRAESGTPSLVP
ncbi:hypothetical protein OWR29_44585 [Actinoplanes sp. Pm04-4]|uniref:Integral membrane protein n=1 Tax=Paractinoplanes pyxinae TaxID=2997416 RepID=A0ABT4BGN1_9ACTN|nr:hypothetical protein [Actinoplanes pyxinae]MCY1145122.1 hypothetical protein [Actinoplanes pyxinae]